MSLLFFLSSVFTSLWELSRASSLTHHSMISCVSSTQPHPGPSNTDFHTPAMCHSVTTISHVVSSSSMSPLSTLPSSHHIVHHTHHHIDWQQSSQQSPVKFQARDLHCRSTQRNSVVFSVYKNQTLFYFNHLMFMLSRMVYRLRAQSFVCLFCVCTSLTKWSMTLLVIQLPIKYFTRVTSLDSLASCRCQKLHPVADEMSGSAWHADEYWQVFNAHVHITDEWMTTATKGRVMYEYERSKSLWRM